MHASDIIIVSTFSIFQDYCSSLFLSKILRQVEGEMDKLAMEEAGFRNCVSVPDGAPSRVSDKDVPSPDQVGAF